MSADTIVPNPGNPADWNRYAYVRNSPVVLVDATGHAPNAPPRIDGQYTVESATREYPSNNIIEVTIVLMPGGLSRQEAEDVIAGANENLADSGFLIIIGDVIELPDTDRIGNDGVLDLGVDDRNLALPSDRLDNDIAIYFVPSIDYQGDDYAGIGLPPGFFPDDSVYAVFVSDSSIGPSRTLAHELGHACTLRHPNDPDNTISIPESSWPDNLMTITLDAASVDNSNELLPAQVRQMRDGVKDLHKRRITTR